MKTTFAIILCLALQMTTAHAAVMNFSTAPLGTLFTGPYEQNGIRLTVMRGHYDILDCAAIPCPAGSGNVLSLGQVSLHSSGLVISLVSQGSFTFNSIDFPIGLPLTPSLDIYAPWSDVTLSGPATSFVPSSGFSQISTLYIQTSGYLDNGVLLDNIRLTEVPEPSAAPTLAAVFAGLFAYRLYKYKV